MSACPHLTAQRTASDIGAQHQCDLVAQITGMTDAWVTDNCLGSCAGDDGTSICSLTINSLLRLRVVTLWDEAGGGNSCAGSLSVAQAFSLLLARTGQDAAEVVLVEAVAAGMPTTQAEALATANNLTLD